ncbi:MAG: hypothetical protein GY750_16090 [Lentisphaerae bacterium]|nr:hypothetical protein [Lentisphaerota bacterium]MCP4102916.1 hypothetical protein [Lentisphaerota bacterium]
MSKHKKFYILLGVLVLIALGLRLVASYEMQSCMGGLNPVNCPSKATDMCTYINLAKSIVDGKYTGMYYYQPFYYAVFLPVIYFIFGFHVWPVIITQALLGAVTVGLTGLTGALMWGRKAGVIAAVLTAFSQMLIFFTPFHMIVNLQAFWLLLIIFLATLALRKKSLWFWLICALVTGLGILTRGNIWFLVPGLLLASCFSIHRAKSLSASKAKLLTWLLPLIILIVILLPQLPFAMHNTKVLGKLSGPSTAAGNVLALGNTPEAPPGGRNAGLPAGPMEYPPTYYSWTANAEKVSVQSRILQWFCTEPGAFIELTFRKLLLFWDSREIPNNVSLSGTGKYSKVVRATKLCSTGLIVAFALGAIFILPGLIWHRRSIKLALLIYSVLAYWLATGAFYNLARFRAPLIPLLAILAGIFVMRFFECRRNMKYGGAYIVFFPAIALGFFITFNSYDFYRNHVEAKMMTWVRPNGVCVQLSPVKTMYLDNGPFTFGGWTPVLLSSGTSISKRFVLQKGTAVDSKATLEFTLLFGKPGELIFKTNGRRFKFRSDKIGVISKKFNIPYNNTGLVEIFVLGTSGDIFCLMDQQRFYGRTLLNSEKEKAELVCRLFLNSNTDKNQ